MDFSHLTKEQAQQINDLVTSTEKALHSITGMDLDITFVAHGRHQGDEPCKGSAVFSVMSPEATHLSLMQAILVLDLHLRAQKGGNTTTH